MILFDYISYIDLSNSSFIILSFSLLYFGFFGIFVNKRNIIIILLFFELILLSVSFNFLSFSMSLDMLIAQTFVLYILSIAGSEVSIGLAVVILLFRIKGVLNLDFFLSLKG